MQRSSFLAFLVFAVLLVGCEQQVPVPITGSDIVGNRDRDKILWIQILTSDDCAAPGDVIRLRASVTNYAPQAFYADLKDKPVLDVVVDAGGKKTRWSDGKPLSANLTQLWLEPGETRTIKADWKVESADAIEASTEFISSSQLPPVTDKVTITDCSKP